MIVTLLTDFGTADYFVGAMKGAILSVCPSAHIVDLTHGIPAHDVHAAAFTLCAACETFPPQTVHVAVVDPGVGSARRPIVVAGHKHLFVGPDNGIFSYIYAREPDARVFHLTNGNYFRPSVSATFHGRDLFAPVAGAIANGIEPRVLGEMVTNYTKFPLPTPKVLEDESLEASVIHIDHFGNCITNITARDLTDEHLRRGVRLRINEHEIRSVRRFFAESAAAGDDAKDQFFAVWGSAGFLEIAAYCDSAARLLGVRRGASVKIINE